MKERKRKGKKERMNELREMKKRHVLLFNTFFTKKHLTVSDMIVL